MKVSEEQNYLEALKDKDLENKKKVSIIEDLKSQLKQFTEGKINNFKVCLDDKIKINIHSSTKDIEQVCDVVFENYSLCLKHKNGRLTRLDGLSSNITLEII